MKLNVLLLLFYTFNIFGIEYDSVHDATYWFYDEELESEGWYIGTVRSNLIYNDKLRFAIAENNCNQIPSMYFTLSSNKVSEIKRTNQGFNIKNIEGQKIKFKAFVDEYDPFIIDATINIADEINSETSMFFIEFDNGMPRSFIKAKKNDPDSFVDVMMLQIEVDNWNYSYFDTTQIKFRMGGLINVWMHANQRCLDNSKANND